MSILRASDNYDWNFNPMIVILISARGWDHERRFSGGSLQLGWTKSHLAGKL
jgi:hypothetical protein